jgi:hypothetical protein
MHRLLHPLRLEVQHPLTGTKGRELVASLYRVTTKSRKTERIKLKTQRGSPADGTGQFKFCYAGGNPLA